MLRIWREQRGASVIEYILVLPLLLLLFLGTLEVFRLMSVKQSLRTGLRQALPYFTHWRERAPHYFPPEYVIVEELDKNPFTIRVYRLDVYPDASHLETMDYGDLFELTAEAEVELGFLYPLEGGPRITLRESYQTFIDSAPEYFELNVQTPFPKDPGDY